jgi:hypothetical protein
LNDTNQEPSLSGPGARKSSWSPGVIFGITAAHSKQSLLPRNHLLRSFSMNIANSFANLLMAALFLGQVAATADQVEIKFVVKEAEVEKATRALTLDKKTAERKTVYFFDTKDLSLFKQAGTSVILRARSTTGEQEGETTVKLRSKGRLKIEEEWMQKRRKGERLDRKFEKDQVVSKPAIESYSLAKRLPAAGNP